MHGTSVRFTEMDVIRKTKRQTLLVCLSGTMYQCPCSSPSFQKSPSHLLLNHPERRKTFLGNFSIVLFINACFQFFNRRIPWVANIPCGGWKPQKKLFSITSPTLELYSMTVWIFKNKLITLKHFFLFFLRASSPRPLRPLNGTAIKIFCGFLYVH